MSLEQEQKQPFRELVEEGKSDAEIREAMGITQATINYEKKILRAIGLLPYKAKGKPRLEIAKEKKNEIVKLAEQGKTNAEIAYAISVSVQTLLKYKKVLRAEGVVIANNAPMGRPKTVKTCPHCGGILA